VRIPPLYGFFSFFEYSAQQLFCVCVFVQIPSLTVDRSWQLERLARSVHFFLFFFSTATTAAVTGELP
jgi:hypothetical protein